jgi:hypothetical protein
VTGGRRSPAALLLTILLALAATACGEDKPANTIAAPPPSPGYSRVIGTGFTIDMPAGWQQPLLDPAAFEMTAAALRAQNPQLAEALEKIRSQTNQHSRLFAIDPGDGSSVNLIVTAAGGRSLDELVNEAIKELEQVGVTSVRHDKTTLAGRSAARLQFSLPVRGESGMISVPEAQYYLLHDKRLFILTLFGSSPSLNVIAESLRVS